MKRSAMTTTIVQETKRLGSQREWRSAPASDENSHFVLCNTLLSTIGSAPHPGSFTPPVQYGQDLNSRILASEITTMLFARHQNAMTTEECSL
jgi:hypothetical protein